MNNETGKQRREPHRRPQLFDQDAGGVQSPANQYREVPMQPVRQAPQAPVRKMPPPRRRSSGASAFAQKRNSGSAGAPSSPRGAATPPRYGQEPSPLTKNRTTVRSQNGRALPQRRKKKTSKVLISLLMVVAVLATGVFAIYNVFQNRMDGTDTPAGVLTAEVKTLPEFKGDNVSFLVCGLGYDNDDATGYATEEKIGQTDMILYVYFNVKDNKISMLQIPRDTYVGDSVKTGGTGKMNALYFHAPDKQNRMQALASVINDQFKLPVDFYVTIDLDALKALVDVKGSIEVYVPMDVTDPGTNSKIEEGWRHLKGNQLEFLLRNRTSPNYNGQSDIARMRMQQSFYSALYREFKQLTPKDLMMWMNVLTYYCKTDKDLVGLSGIGLKALNLEGSDITFVRPPCGAVSHNGQSLISLVGDETADLLNQYFRPEGQSFTTSELNLHTIPISESMGVVPAEVKSMADVQAGEPAPA